MRTYRLGLSLAGAISAGAYAAGVLDFLLEAIESWERAKRRERAAHGDDFAKWSVPCHDVRIEVITGASAGSINALILAEVLGRARPIGAANPFYHAWVTSPTLEAVTADADLDRKRPLGSLLNSDWLPALAGAMRADAAQRAYAGWPPWFAEPMEVHLTTGNLRGVDYRIRFSNALGENRGHGMRRHADVRSFYLSESDQQTLRALGYEHCDPRALSTAAWQAFDAATLASGAFPVGLHARRIAAPGEFYRGQNWRIPRTFDAGILAQLPADKRDAAWFEEKPILPASAIGEAYDYVSVDGGIANNEPFEIARRVLARSRPRNPRDGATADAGVLMVDPFPSDLPEAPWQPKDGLFNVIGALAGAFIEQARFKPEELALAEDDTVYSRFLVAPVRRKGRGQPVERNGIACGVLGGFGGFLSQRFRSHDYQLGRLNAYGFLKEHLALYAENEPVFGDWPKPGSGAPMNRWDFDSDDDRNPALKRLYRPLIPVMDEISVPEPTIAWPDDFSQDEFDAAMNLIGARIDALKGRLNEPDYVKSWWARRAVDAAWFFARGGVVGGVRNKLADALNGYFPLRTPVA